MDEYLGDLLPVARAHALAPISNFAVGAVAQGLSGALYLGANVEFPGLGLGASVHAEQSAVANAWSHGEAGLAAIAVTAAPCGHCRQFLNELATADRLEILIAQAAPTTLAALLPAAFGPHDLGVSGGLMQPATHGLRLESPSPPADHAVELALAAADASYAPYSAAYAGIALTLADGSIQTGRYAENAAFNPSLPPLQAALAGLAGRSVPYGDIRAAVLVEVSGPVSQRAAADALIATIAPNVVLTYLRAVATAP